MEDIKLLVKHTISAAKNLMIVGQIIHLSIGNICCAQKSKLHDDMFAICRSDCMHIVSDCVDWKNMPPEASPGTLCDALAPHDKNCFSVQDYMGLYIALLLLYLSSLRSILKF